MKIKQTDETDSAVEKNPITLAIPSCEALKIKFKFCKSHCVCVISSQHYFGSVFTLEPTLLNIQQLANGWGS